MDLLVSIVNLPLVTSIIGCAFVGMLLWTRANSTHSVLDRLWRLLGGDADVHDEKIKAFMKDFLIFGMLSKVPTSPTPSDELCIKQCEMWLQR
jgi:hypothetical protein